MARVDSFILNTDLDTLKNDGKVTVVVKLNKATVAGAGKTSAHKDIAVGSPHGITNVKVKSKKDGDYYFISSPYIMLVRWGKVQGFPDKAVYNVYPDIKHLGGGVIRTSVNIYNPYQDTLTLDGVEEEMTFDIRTFLTPKF